MAKIVTLQVLVDDGDELDAEGFLKELLDNQAAEGGIEGPVFDYRFIGKPQQVPLEVEDAMRNETYERGDIFPTRSATVLPKDSNLEPSDRDPKQLATVVVKPGYVETDQMNGFMNASIQGAGERHAFSVATLFAIPEDITSKGEDAIATYIADSLDRAASVVDGLQFQVALGLSADYEHEETPGVPAN
jgi:hypothetical protein